MRLRLTALTTVAVFLVSLIAFIGTPVSAATVPQGWFFQASGVAHNLQSVCAVSPTVAWAVGSNDTILKTTDGTTWQKQVSGTTGQDFTAVHALDATHAWVVGDGSIVLRTVDGVNWAPPLAPIPGPTVALQGVQMLSANVIWISGYNGSIFKTIDGGANWIDQSTGGQNLFDIAASDTNNGWVVGNEGRTAKTINGGASWLARNPGTTQKLRGVKMVGANTVWAVGFSGTIVRSTNGGINWVQQPSLVDDILSDITVPVPSVAWAVGFDDFSTVGGFILKTENAGASWFKQPTPAVGDLNGVSAADTNVAWAVGSNGRILKTVSGGAALDTWYLAEGSSDWGFDTYVTIENPNAQAVTAAVTYQTRAGEKTRADIPLPAQSQTVINPRDDIGSTDFSTKVRCKEGKSIAVDRRMTWTGPGASYQESHCSIGVTAPDRTWFLPEGSSDWGFETWLLIQNPNATEANVTVTYMIEGETPIQKTKKVPAGSRASYDMKEDIGQKDASIKVESDLQVIPERAMYRYNRREGHDSIGTINPSQDYYLAEGCTAYGFTTFILIQNPQPDPILVDVEFMTGAGPVSLSQFRMEANTRETINVNTSLTLPDPNFSTRVHGSEPIIAERAMYWNRGYGETCHDSIGMPAAHRTFYLPDGESTSQIETWTLVQNPNASDLQVSISYLTQNGQGNVTKTETIPASSRRTFEMGQHSGISGRASIVVTSTSAVMPIMVERSMYWPRESVNPSMCRGAGTDTIGGPDD